MLPLRVSPVTIKAPVDEFSVKIDSVIRARRHLKSFFISHSWNTRYLSRQLNVAVGCFDDLERVK